MNRPTHASPYNDGPLRAGADLPRVRAALRGRPAARALEDRVRDVVRRRLGPIRAGSGVGGEPLPRA